MSENPALYTEYQREAEAIALRAGEYLRGVFGKVTAREKKPGDLVTDADLGSQDLIAEGLGRAFPDHAILGEERGLIAEAGNPFRWIVDPIDGTMNFAHGFPLWCVSIGLEHEGELVAGVILDPLQRRLWSASKNAGTFVDGERVHVSTATTLSSSLITTGIPADFGTGSDGERQVGLFRRFSTGTHSVRRTGSSALNLAFVAMGACEVFYSTHVNAWDVAAGVVLVREAGGIVTGLHGEPYLVDAPSILASNSLVHTEALARARD